MHTFWHLREELSAAAMALVGEYDDLPAGSVLRHFGRAVRFARVAETPNEDIARLATEITRAALGPRAVDPIEMLRTA